MLRPYILKVRPSDTPLRNHPRQPQRERASHADRTAHPNSSPLQFRQQSRDREPQAGATQLAAAGLIDSKEAVKDLVHMLGGDAGPRVPYAHADLGAIAYDGKCHSALRRVTHRVRREIEQDVSSAIGIADGFDWRGWGGAHDERLVQGHRFRDLSDFVDDGAQVERGMWPRLLSVLAPRDEQPIFHHLR